jgi:6-phosphogluconolactonase/glucosamine-6-phosphate isomerase/deaminase
VAVAGGRGGRAIMLSLAERTGIPWDRIRATVVDDVCAPAAEAHANRRLLQESLGAARGVPNGGGPQPTMSQADAVATFEDEVRGVAGADVRFDLIVVELGPNGELGVLTPGSTDAANATAPFAQTQRTGDTGADAHRIGLGPGPFARATRVIVVALGADRSRALRRALCDPAAEGEPASLVHPSDRAEWFVDRAAAAELLRDAQPARA